MKHLLNHARVVAVTQSLTRTASSASAERRLVFISHANPEQNDFVLWLGVQLANAGYEVWSDITKLIGGEVFWDDIEDAIRHHTAKFVLVVSQAALNKEGVKDEINLGVMVERTQKVDKFVVPIRVDDVPFSEFKANIARKNAIDFTGGWAPALAKLFEVLERDQTPRGKVNPTDVRQWCDQRFVNAQKPTPEPERLVSNWLRITGLPDTVSVLDIGLAEAAVRDAMSDTKLPWFPYYRLVGTLGTVVDLQQDLPTHAVQKKYELTLADFLAGKPPAMPGVKRADARRMLVSMLRQSWNNAMEAKGLLPFQMADNSIAWFFPKGLIEKDTAHFVDHTGKRRRKAMVGRSETRGVYWHLGFIAKPNVGGTPHFIMKAAIIFTLDGKTPLDSVEKMHKLRRGFCRNWWNDQWRNLMLAYVDWIAEGGPFITLPIGDSASIKVDAAPMEFTSPVSCPDPAVKAKAKARDQESDEDETPPEAPVEGDETSFLTGFDGDGDD